jgi:betaine-aldehyde dehydrogenase
MSANVVSTAAKKNFVDGRWQKAHSGDVLDVENPASGDVFTTIPASRKSDIDEAVQSARRSFQSGVWSQAVPAHRGRVLWKLSELIREHLEELAQLETRDTGKPIREAREDMLVSADTFEFYAGLANKIVGQTFPMPSGQFATTFREPVGVVGAITPWNFPLFCAALKTAPALACGNSVVLKPSELASLTSLVMAELGIEAGLPAGVLNVVCGLGEEAGASLARHPGVDMLAFTGGIETGKLVMAARATLAKPIEMELGGKSPQVIFADADLPRAVAAAAFGIYYAQGENCNAGSRLLVQKGIHDEFVSRLVEFTRHIRVLPPTDEQSQLGALISHDHLEKVLSYVRKGSSEGSKVELGGSRFDEAPLDTGYFVEPTVLTGVKPGTTVFTEEIFGPVVTVTEFADEEEGIELANATDYGLAAGVWTNDVARAWRLVRKIASGYVWVNGFNTTPIEAPFGGVKGSGFGRDMGVQAIDSYLAWKTVSWSVEPFQDWYGQLTEK